MNNYTLHSLYFVNITEKKFHGENNYVFYILSYNKGYTVPKHSMKYSLFFMNTGFRLWVSVNSVNYRLRVFLLETAK